jgi:hypothetical protein
MTAFCLVHAGCGPINGTGSLVLASRLKSLSEGLADIDRISTLCVHVATQRTPKWRALHYLASPQCTMHNGSAVERINL